MMNEKMLTEKQKAIVSKLVETFGIDGDRILFLNQRDQNEPWIPPGILEQIALHFEGYRSSSVSHDKYIPETKQTVYVATVTDAKDRVFTRSGVATVGEVAGNDLEIDVDYLAQGRALSLALKAAGFNPVKSLGEREFFEQQEIETEGIRRTKDLKAIHAEATKKGLIVMNDYSAYRRVLAEKFGVKSAAVMNADERQQLLNYLKNYEDDFADLPEELREEEIYV